MIKIRVIDKEGKDEVHTLLKLTVVDGKLWCYAKGVQYYIPADTISFMQIWEDTESE